MNQSKLVTEVTLADLRRLGNQGNATARLDNGDEIKLTSRYGLVSKNGYLAGKTRNGLDDCRIFKNL